MKSRHSTRRPWEAHWYSGELEIEATPRRARQSGGGADDFRCAVCGGPVSTQPWLSGVSNRNHCPYCLWSRHMDLFKAGDRLSACKAPMQPVALTLKRSQDKYARGASGELMIVHHCTGCGRVSINRIAADDDAQTILEVFARSRQLDHETRECCEAQGIHILRQSEAYIVEQRLFGKN